MRKPSPGGCNQFAILSEQMKAEGKPEVIAWGFVCGSPHFEVPKKKARRAFLARTTPPEPEEVGDE